MTPRHPLRRFRRETLAGIVVMMACAVTVAATVAHAQDAGLTVRFRDRVIDLGPFLEGFPYTGVEANYDSGSLLYFRETRTARELWTLPLTGESLDLDRGHRLGNVDWNTRAFRSFEYDPPRHSFVVVSDDANEERYNLFRLSLDSGVLTRMTDKPYVYGFGIDKEHRFLGYVPRYGTGEPYHACLDRIDLASGEDREVVCDSRELTLTWTYVNFSPDGRTVVLSALRGTDRNHENLVAVDLSAPSPRFELLTDPSVRRRNVNTVRQWLDPHHLVYTSDESGFTNVYIADLATRTSRAVTNFREDVEDVVPLLVEGRAFLAAMIKRPYESEVVVVDPENGEVRARHVFEATAVFLDFHDARAMLRLESRRTRFELQEITLRADVSGQLALDLAARARMPPDIASRIEQCDVERVAVPTFDIDPHTGHARMLHAYLQTPRMPPTRPARRFALVQAFYGGENVFDVAAQILCAAGGIVLSPAVRGSEGFGAEFAALNDHDLGGNEIIDVIESGRYLVRRFGLRERQVGVYGASHGGYAAMRAITFPAVVNGHHEAFHWGFGISWFGFSNILSFYAHSNIPDWVLLEAGDPRSERDRLWDRSPLAHAADAVAPLLLLHGERDSRVPVDESRQMAAALRAAHRPVTYVEFAGQGHGLKGIENQKRVWREVFGFLHRVLDAAPAQVAWRMPVGRRWLGAMVALLVMVALVGATVALARRGATK